MISGIRSFLRQDDGVTAVEFSLVALPMMLMIFAIIELSLFFASGNVLEGASQEAGRRIRTGQVQAAEDPELAFKNELCGMTGLMVDCTKVQYEVIHIDDNSFSTAESLEPEFDEDGNLIPAAFNAGGSSDVILIRSYYRWNFLTPFIGEMLTGMPGGGWIGHLSTVVLRTEPYCTSIIQENC